MTATPLSLRPQLSLKAKFFRITVFMGVLLAALYTGMQLGEYRKEKLRSSSSLLQQNQMQGLQQRIDFLQKEQALLSQQLTVVGAERDALKRELTALQQDFAITRETLSFFESLLQSNDRNRSASFVACELQTSTVDRLRYRLLLVQGTDKTTELAGRLFVSVQYQLDGKKQQLTANTQGASIAVAHYHRAEGEFELPVGATGPFVMEARLVEPQGSKVLASCQKKF
ncbi:DUF6776 family protein [Deefgea sp. CFH1-16]|uniref:DUF6776 family protein n=1 Tax=Deefgea sp. CFH1-16 TaxID=2675457 RepID=UPI0015F619A8|nr:DUF6776 family protein [Deefgea sp. CFH1-16]MBM5573839.1 hypothetical protein [Deefgea sp. CFH1-16]